MHCSACGSPADDAARFCATCGRSLRAVDDERRVVTVLFADIVGFTTLSERLDPERVKNLVDRCFERLAVDVNAFGGQVDKIVGDAIVALFGAPVAHEDDAERAVRAALRMQQTLLEEVAEIGQALQIRVGVNTGEVLVGAMRAAGSVTAMGDVVNTASRLQTAAAPGEVLVGPATHAATAHTIAYEPRGALAAKGRDEPVETWRALAPTLPPGHRARRVDAPLVGRDHEVGLLRNAVDASISNGRALMVLLLGDVGMGKTRLADEVAGWAKSAHGVVVREGRCVPYGEANVWWPVADALRDGLGVGDGGTLEEDREAVLAQVAVALRRPVTDPEVGRTSDGLLTLLGHEAAPGTDPAAVREDAGRALGVYTSALSSHRPLVLQLSDLHWADDAVLTLIDDIFATVHHCPVVVLATARPALLDQWTPRPGRHNALVLHLDPLGRVAAGALLDSLVGQPVPPEVANVVLDRSGGNPFFLEELVSLLDGAATGSDGPDVSTLPDTLRGLVAARLDDLEAAPRSLLQNASVIGQRGPVTGLREMCRHFHPELDVDAALVQLVDDEVMELDEDMWAFRSDLVREVAYQTITKADRAKAHLGIAHYLEEAVASRRPRPVWVVDQLAHHYATAVALAGELGPVGRLAAFPPDLAEHARRWVVEAAERATRDQALPTAIRLYGQALTLLGPEGSTAPAEAARLHLARAAAATEAWDHATARADVNEAFVLSDGADDPLVAADALVIRGRIEQQEGDVDAAVATLAEAVDRYAGLGADAGRAEALRQRGMVEIFGGRIAEAETSARQALVVFEELGDPAGQGWALQNLAWTGFVTGRTDEADHHVRQAMEHFSEVGDTRGLAWSLGLLSWIRFRQHRVVEAAGLGQQVLEEARARNDPWATAMMTLLLASVRMWSGQCGEAVEMAGRARRTFESIGEAYGLGVATAVLGRSLVMVGRVDEGFALLGSVDGPNGPGGLSGAAAEDMTRFTRLAAALQIGEPARALGVIAEIEAWDGIGGDDPAVALGLAALQLGDLGRASSALDLDRATEDPNLASAQTLLAAAVGAPDTEERADRVASLDGATYLDRALAQVGAALQAAAEGRAESASGRIEAARLLVDASDDLVAQAVVALAAGEVACRSGEPDGAAQLDRARRGATNLGIEPVGWASVFELTAHPPELVHR